jgi:hypothetical protein
VTTSASGIGDAGRLAGWLAGCEAAVAGADAVSGADVVADADAVAGVVSAGRLVARAVSGTAC